MQYVYYAKPKRNIRRLTSEPQSLDDFYDMLATRWAKRAERDMKRQHKKLGMVR
jgi:hypothetical protein